MNKAVQKYLSAISSQSESENPKTRSVDITAVSKSDCAELAVDATDSAVQQSQVASIALTR